MLLSVHVVVGVLCMLCGVSGQSASDPVQKPGTAQCVGSHCTAEYYYYSPNLAITEVDPPIGPIQGGTEVVVKGSGFRNFGRLMKCKFGDIEVPARLRTEYGNVFNPYNGDTLICEAPAVVSSRTVTVEVTLTGDTYTTDGVTFSYYEHPTIEPISNYDGNNTGEELTIVGSGFNKTSILPTPNVVCRFTTATDPLGNAQVDMDETSAAVLHSDTVITCYTPASTLSGEVYVTVSLNGQDFTDPSPNVTFFYKDNWRSATASGEVPSHREFHTTNLVGCVNSTVASGDFRGCTIILFGGWAGGFLKDMHVLHLDVFSDFYPNKDAQDWAWTEITPALDQGVEMDARAKHTVNMVGTSLYVYGGIKDWGLDAINEMYKIDFNLKVSVEPVDEDNSPQNAPKRCDHTMNHMTLDGEEYLVLYGGKSLVAVPGYEGDASLGYTARYRFKYSGDIFRYHIANRTWELYISEESYDEHFYGRAGHAAQTYGSTMVIFGGDAYIPDYPFSGYYGANIKVNDTMVLDMDTGTFSYAVVTNTAPENRTQHTSYKFNDKFMFIFGGLGDNGALNDLWYIDMSQVTTGTQWIRLSVSGEYPTPRYSMTSVVLPSNEIWFFGGTGSGIYGKDQKLLNLESETALW